MRLRIENSSGRVWLTEREIIELAGITATLSAEIAQQSANEKSEVNHEIIGKPD